MGDYTWMCPTELDRERLVTTVDGVGRARVVMFVVLTVLIGGSVGQIGWWPLAVLLVAAVASIYFYRDLGRHTRPEYWAAAGWLTTQVPLGLGIAITGGPRSPALPWLAIAVVSLVARFNRVTIRLGMVFLYAVLLAGTLPVDPRWTLAHPASLLFTSGLLFAVWVFAEALMRTDLRHRDHDKVTGLANHAKFMAQLQLVLARREHRDRAISVLALDLDGFGLINDSLGPRAGDRLLSQVAARIARAATQAELVARSSADEFLLLLSDLNDPATGVHEPWESTDRPARELADSLQAAVMEPIDVDGREIYLTACVGIAMLDEGERVSNHEKVAEGLLSSARLALSSARSAGPSNVTVYDSSRRKSQRRLSVTMRLHRALERGELALHYQPTVDLHTGAIRGVEALARWEDAELGAVPPTEFIPVAEESGLIEPLGAWVMSEVARQAREWEKQDMQFEIAFNVSPRQLWQPALLPRMRTSLAEAGVPFERFVIEITESSALRDFESTVALLGEMRAQGFRIAIDDFGVELSSLSRLLEIPSDVLKIDRSFVSALSSTPNAAKMVQTIIQLASNLGMRAHAEGVETEVERRFLLANGCEFGQGFFFSTPVPATKIRERYLDSLVPGLPRGALLPREAA